ncbi:DEKNAAC101507 [Brettanomyces naardenensis]|uniref:DEKNAAC101507 n=1 Tax=Brettanomyces naardenensis TaxID=13370 RepID=A0A448YI61_BRENA|nr:DEKNAAC101507 [Brettanomyces naardenensis]
MNTIIPKYALSLQSAITQLAQSHPLPQLTEKPIFDAPSTLDTLLKSGFDSLNLDDLSLDKNLFFNAIITDVLNSYMETYLDEKDSSEAPSAPTTTNAESTYLHHLLLVLDVSLALGNHFSVMSCPMQTLNTILLTCCPTDFAVNQFGRVFFSEAGRQRRLAITLNKPLVGKARPGSTLLQIGNNMIPKLFNEFEENDYFSARLRFFVQNSIDVADKLSLDYDWRLNSLDGLYTGYSKTRGWPSRRSLSASSTTSKHIFVSYMAISLWITSFKSPEDMGKELATLFNRQRNGTNILDELSRLVKSLAILGRRNHKKTPKSNDKPAEYECDWILDADEFALQLKRRDSLNSLLFQILIILDYMLQFNLKNIESTMKKVQLKNSKCKRPSMFNGYFTSDAFRQNLEKLKADVLQLLDVHDQRLMNHILEDTEAVWRSMKLQQFSHPDIKQIQSLSESKKRKYEEYLKDCNENPFEKKKAYFHEMGVPRLSRAWKSKTGLAHIKEGMSDEKELLESYKDELYMAEGKVEEKRQEVQKSEGLENSAEVKEELEGEIRDKNLINWKMLRLSRSRGGWTAELQTN